MLLGIIISIAGILLGGFLLAGGIRRQKRFATCEDWPAVTGGVVSVESAEVNASGVESDKHKKTVVTLKYEYVVNGLRYISNQLSPGESKRTFSDSRRARAFRGSFSQDEPLRVYYFPDDPYESVLEPKADKGGLTVTMIIGAALVLVGIGNLVRIALS